MLRLTNTYTSCFVGSVLFVRLMCLIIDIILLQFVESPSCMEALYEKQDGGISGVETTDAKRDAHETKTPAVIFFMVSLRVAAFLPSV